MYDELKAKDIQQHTGTVVEFHGEFGDFFRTSTRSGRADAIL